MGTSRDDKFCGGKDDGCEAGLVRKRSSWFRRADVMGRCYGKKECEGTCCTVERVPNYLVKLIANASLTGAENRPSRPEEDCSVGRRWNTDRLAPFVLFVHSGARKGLLTASTSRHFHVVCLPKVRKVLPTSACHTEKKALRLTKDKKPAFRLTGIHPSQYTSSRHSGLEA